MTCGTNVNPPTEAVGVLVLLWESFAISVVPAVIETPSDGDKIEYSSPSYLKDFPAAAMAMAVAELKVLRGIESTPSSDPRSPIAACSSFCTISSASTDSLLALCCCEGRV